MRLVPKREKEAKIDAAYEVPPVEYYRARSVYVRLRGGGKDPIATDIIMMFQSECDREEDPVDDHVACCWIRLGRVTEARHFLPSGVEKIIMPINIP